MRTQRTCQFLQSFSFGNTQPKIVCTLQVQAMPSLDGFSPESGSNFWLFIHQIPPLSVTPAGETVENPKSGFSTVSLGCYMSMT
jgi:hypothetical protein